MRLRKSLLFVLIYLSFLSSQSSYAQTYPSALSTQFINANTLFLDEYADPFQPHIKTTIHFTDFTEASWTFALRLKITGPNGILIQTKLSVKAPHPVSVAPGQPYELQGADLAFYFNYNNLNFSGISRNVLEVNNRLPEGFYTFCFEAIDYETGKALSLPSCASAYLRLNDPAIIIHPTCSSVIENISFQNIFFQWQLSNANGNLNINALSYQINLYEVNNNWVNPVTAILNNQALPIWQSFPLTQMNYVYGVSEPPLEKGKRYVFTVRTMEASGRSSFKNEGYSTPCYFHYGYHENDTIDIIKPINDFQFTLSTASQFKWSKPRKALPNQFVTYTLKLVEVNNGQDPGNAILNNAPFYQQSYLPVTDETIEKTIPVTFWANIKRMGHYAWQVSAQSGTQLIAKSKVQTFIGPPEIESFIAGGFLMSVTRLTAFNKTSNIISGSCKTNLTGSAGSEATEFHFSNIGISPIGNNEWVMISGSMADKISTTVYSLQPQTYEDNKTALFKADSVFVNSAGIKLSGKVEWNFPHASTGFQIEKLISKRCKLTLANTSFYLNNANPIRLEQDYSIELLEPLGFMVKINQSSEMLIAQSKYEFSFSGFVQLPEKVKNSNQSATHIAFQNSSQLHYISQSANLNSESLQLSSFTKFSLWPTSYVIDLSEKQSPGEFSSDNNWKGCYITLGKLQLPKLAESSGQISLPLARELNFTNTTTDTNRAYVTHRGLFFTATQPFTLNDSLKFNGFVSKSGYFYSRISESEIDRAFISGGIYIPVLDTLNSFPYFIDWNDYGFNEGYLLNALANTSFTFNPAGSAEQRIAISIQRAVFKGRNRLDMDLNMSWPHFNLSLNGVQRFTVWGNGNIGFDVPNGKAALTYQATGKASNYDITVDYLGCGRNGNAYAFGASAKINMDEEISGDNGAPIINAYSIYKNPLLTGMVFIPTTNSTSATTNTTNSTTYQSSTNTYSNALGSGMGDALGQLGFQSDDTSTYVNRFNTNNPLTPLVSNNVVTQIRQLIEIVYRLKPFINSKDVTDRDWMVLDRFKSAMDQELISQTQVTNAKGLLNFVLNKVVDGLIFRLNQPIQNISDQAMGKVRSAISTKITLPVNNRIDNSLTSVFQKLQQRVLAQVDEQYHTAVVTTFSVVRANVINGIRISVANSFETNITSKLDNFVQLGVTGKIKSFVRKEVSAAGTKLINEGASTNINLTNVLQNAGTLFQSISDTVKDVLMEANSANFINTAESLVDDVIHGIDWNAISNQILNELLKRGISSAISSQISSAVSANAGPYVNAVLNTVKFDFSNLGEKLQNGQFDKIVKFDPTTIYIESPAVDVRGTLIFTKNDPTYGDSWQANVMVRVKVPKKDNPIEINGFFLNGKTTQLTSNFTYWFVRLSASGFSVPLTPAPVIWDGIEGFAYSKMKKLSATSVMPDAANKFGVGCKFYFFDQQSSGKTYLFDLGAEAEFNEGGFAIQLVGNASVLNYQKEGSKYKSPGFVTGSGTLGYYKTPTYSKIAGNFSVTLHTEPILCAGGEVGLDLQGPSNWRVWVGTQQHPIAVKILCKDFLSNTAFMQVSNSGFAAGLAMNVNINARSPWVQFPAIKVRGFATLNFGYNANTSISWDPTFRINEATISAWLSAAIGIDYETLTTSSSLTLAGVSLAGTLTYKSNPESELHGAMSGSITVIGFNLGFNTPVHYSLSKQEIIN